MVENNPLRKLAPYYVPNTWYAITICPDDIHQKTDKSCENRYNRFRKYMVKEISQFELNNTDISLVIEISEPHGSQKKGYLGPRLHAHGIIKFNNRAGIQYFLLKGYHMLLHYNIVDIDTIDDMSFWMKYCNKQHVLPQDRKINYHLMENVIKDIRLCEESPPPPINE